MAMRFALALLVLLELCVATGSQDSAVAKLFEANSRTLTLAEGKKITMPYRLLKPETIEADKRYPLVLFLHGFGARGDDNQAQLGILPTWMAGDENREKYPCFVLAPQCPAGMEWTVRSAQGNPGSPLGKISGPMQAVVAILDEVIERNPVDRSRIYLTGMSLGGKGVWELAERMPDRFAAVAPICGGGNELYASRLVGVPIWAWHGDADSVIPVERSRAMIAAIEKAGGTPKYTELKGVDHDSWTAAYTGPDNLLPWMFEQVKSAAEVR